MALNPRTQHPWRTHGTNRDRHQLLRHSLTGLILLWAIGALASNSPTEPSFKEELIVWNVGQGLWTTLKTQDQCWHFDSGGERAPWMQILTHCAERKNRISFSHWDMDHINFARAAARRLKSFCIAHLPGGEAHPDRERLLAKIPLCESRRTSLVAIEIQHSQRRQLGGTKKREGRNHHSRVFLLRSRALVPGDSTSLQERQWAPRIPHASVHILVLGHHGSHTSTSQVLLSRLRKLRQAIASARQQKYGHPHSIVTRRLRTNKIALLKTEDWGSIHLELNPTNDVYKAQPPQRSQRQSPRQLLKPHSTQTR